jgi:hypothetical protein
MGTPISGRETIIGAVKGTTWGTPVACGANHGLLVLSSGLGRGFETLEDQSLGSMWELDPQRGRLTADGDLTGWLRYDNNEWLLIAQLMGTAGVPAQQTGGGAVLAYRHVLQLADGIAGNFATVAQKMKSDEVWEFASVKPVSMRITGGKRVPLQYTIACQASHLTRNAGSGTNNTTTIATITHRETLRRIVPDEAAYFRINAQSGGGLAGGDNHPISTFELVFTRPQEGDHVLDGNVFVTEPTGTAHAMPTSCKVTFPVYEDKADALLDAYEADTPMKAEIFAQGGIIDGTERYRITIQMPQAILVDRPELSIPGPGKLACTLNLKLTKAAAAPTGMTSPAVTNPFAILLVNKRTTDILA